MIARRLVLALLLAAPAPLVAQEAEAPESAESADAADAAEAADAAKARLETIHMALGRDCTERFLDRELDSLWDDMSGPMRAALGSVEGLQTFRDTIEVQMGAQRELVSEVVFALGDAGGYKRVAKFAAIDAPIEIVWVFGEDLSIGGFTITPVRVAAPSEYLDYETKATFRLPFDEEWFVVWGGRLIEQNYHAYTVDQRFAYDILVIEGGKTHTGDGSRNEDYHAFGRRVLAPADGVVVDAGDGEPDQVPGQMDPSKPLGNFVILDHGNDEYSIMAHFQQGSVAVSKGDRVEAGDFLGRCGNSGNTTEPHIHIHLQDTPVFGKGKGKPIQFTDYRANGVPHERGEPVKGQAVRPLEAEAAGSRPKDHR